MTCKTLQNETAEHRALRLECMRAYKGRNRERIRAQNREYSRGWRAHNPELKRAYARDYYQGHRERLVLYQLEYNAQRRAAARAAPHQPARRPAAVPVRPRPGHGPRVSA